ncbi:hypothetical protein KIN20_016731 [Parelaphostrongylus tenuis]|uniref:tRNA-5-taurinomethyluridine 2-sulfurtransferase n=1 Tax=Parelaphostrongylus tenuis TaxID=148309 RepID=A0AAD5N285_PARTN|nr:hypothetical protein KIN20_016731 [Parelaphostrongylus tenuis]
MGQLRVAVGLSGGVDSAVSAWLLKKRGFDVVGVYMNNWDHIEEGVSSCPRTKDEADARYVCEKLRIPFTIVNFVKEYWNEVFTKMLENYRRARTVVPDVICNREIKFERLHNYAIDELGADLIATGHYASTSFDPQITTHCGDSAEGVKLLCSADPLKDQTPFLCTLQQKQLRRAMFPVGSLTKTQVRQIAREQGLASVADKAESMGICFVGKRKDFDSFIDQCEGSYHPCLYATAFCVLEPQWIDENPLSGNDVVTLECRIQRTHVPIRCEVQRLGQSCLTVRPVFPLRAVADGQMCVFYRGRECLGGGEVQYVISTLNSK